MCCHKKDCNEDCGICNRRQVSCCCKGGCKKTKYCGEYLPCLNMDKDDYIEDILKNIDSKLCKDSNSVLDMYFYPPLDAPVILSGEVLWYDLNVSYSIPGYTIQDKGKYLIMVEETITTTGCIMGIGVNGNDPITSDDKSNKTIESGYYGNKTHNFVLDLNQGDIIKILTKNTPNSPSETQIEGQIRMTISKH